MAAERDPRLNRCALHDTRFPLGSVCQHCASPIPCDPDIRCVHSVTVAEAIGCANQATWAMYWTGQKTSTRAYAALPFCDTHAVDHRGEADTRLAPIIRSAPTAALICAGIHGSPFTPAMLALMSDPDGAAVLLDVVELEWLTVDGWLLPVADREWPERDDHGTGDNPHVWFPCKRSERRLSFESGITEIDVDDHRCTCGLYKSQHFPNRYKVATVSASDVAASQRALNYDARSGRSVVISAELARRATAGEPVAYVTPRGRRAIACAPGGLSWADADAIEPGCTVAFADQTAGETWIPVLRVRMRETGLSRGELWADDADCIDRVARMGRDACRCMEWRGRRWVNRIDPARIRAAEERYERRRTDWQQAE